MRPHQLEVVAFGAFAGTTAVDFDNLEGLFLLHGETGAGKTTLLDAIAFALYGRVPGKRGDVRRLRSDHAPAEVRTAVTLEATIGGRRMRVLRTPEQDRPKKRGDGFTREQASVLVQELTGGGIWETKSTRVGEADTEIADLMGMSAEQFFQVVLLPQGQFAKFLHADAPDRERLLQKLFGTDRFRSVEDWLTQRRRETDNEVRTAEEVVHRLRAQVAQAAGTEVPEEATDPVQWAAALAETADAALGADRELAAVRRRGLEKALAAQRTAQTLADRQQRRQQALDRQRELNASAPQMAAIRGQLDAAARAAEIAPVLTEATRAAKAAEEAARAEQSARAELPDELAGVSAETLRAAATSRLEHMGGLEALREKEEQAAAEEASAAHARQRAAELAQRLTRLESGLPGLRERRDRAAADRDKAQQAAATLVPVSAEADRYRGAAGHAAELARGNTQLATLSAALMTAREKAGDLRDIAQRLRETRFNSMRAELAASLTDDAECPVCGSFDHPNPCELTGERVSREQEDAATLEYETAAAHRDEVAQQVAGVRARTDQTARHLAEAGFEPDADPAALAAEAKRLAGQASQLKAAAAPIDELQAGVEQADAAIARAEKEQAELTEQQRTAERDHESAARRAAAARESLRARLGGAVSLDAAMALDRRAADLLTSAADAADETARRLDEQNRTREVALQEASMAGFDFESARAAYRGLEWRSQQEEQLRRYDAEVRSVADQLVSPDLDVALDPPAQVETATEAVAEAQAAYEAAVDAEARTRDRTEQLATLLPRLKKTIAELEPLRAHAAEVRQLADLACAVPGSANSLRMTLSSFVLAARLEEVAAAASRRLLKMTSGRYSLVHTDARRGGKRSGLGLLACDSWTGVDRDTSTLSGGETFMASLALALGLADVVTAEAAGTPMEALFVDEGFGTLDEETLDEVMNVLDGLREGGRIVGIVSHVAELRQRIPAQVHVRKGQHGSQVTVRSA
jgi:exonuclease SbcC